MDRRFAAAVTAAALVGQMLFPPFHFRRAGGAVTNHGYAFILNPPRVASGEVYASIDVSVLVLQLVVTAIVGALLIWLSRDRDR